MRKSYKTLFFSAFLALGFANVAKSQTISTSFNTPNYEARAELMAIEQNHKLYADAFNAAKHDDTILVKNILSQITDKALLPYIEREIILSSSNPNPQDIRQWLENYNEFYGANEVYNKAQLLSLENVKAPKTYKIRSVTTKYNPPRENNDSKSPDATSFEYADLERAAQSFRNNDDFRAIQFAKSGINSGYSGRIAWYGGLSAFRIGDFEAALKFFDIAANWNYGDDYLKSSGAYWAARTAQKLQDKRLERQYLEQAATVPFSFYGQLALMRLGIWGDLNIPSSKTTNDGINNLVRHNQRVRNAIELFDIGQKDLAKGELSIAWLENQDDDLSLEIIAKTLGFYDLSAKISDGNSMAVVANAYPLPLNLAPIGGDFVLDRALVFAVMRQESRFKPQAVSYAGARGLMQLMPATAAWFAKKPEFRDNPDLLHDKSLNISLGEGYLEYVLGLNAINGSVAKAFMAYNAGPGNVAKWSNSIEMSEDCLMLIEATPSSQARDYVKKVMSNLWIYHKRLGQNAPTLEKLAFDKVPHYEPQDNPRFAGGGTGALNLKISLNQK